MANGDQQGGQRGPTRGETRRDGMCMRTRRGGKRGSVGMANEASSLFGGGASLTCGGGGRGLHW